MVVTLLHRMPSADGGKNFLGLGVLHCEIKQPVIMPATVISKASFVEREIREGEKARRDTQGVRAQCALVTIVGNDLEGFVEIGCHVETAVAEAVEMPVPSGIAFCQLLGKAINNRLDDKRIANAEMLVGSVQALSFRDEGGGDNLVLALHRDSMNFGGTAPLLHPSGKSKASAYLRTMPDRLRVELGNGSTGEEGRQL